MSEIFHSEAIEQFTERGEDTGNWDRREAEVIAWWAEMAARAEMLRDLNAPDAAPAKGATHLTRERR